MTESYSTPDGSRHLPMMSTVRLELEIDELRATVARLNRDIGELYADRDRLAAINAGLVVVIETTVPVIEAYVKHDTPDVRALAGIGHAMRAALAKARQS